MITVCYCEFTLIPFYWYYRLPQFQSAVRLAAHWAAVLAQHTQTLHSSSAQWNSAGRLAQCPHRLFRTLSGIWTSDIMDRSTWRGAAAALQYRSWETMLEPRNTQSDGPFGQSRDAVDDGVTPPARLSLTSLETLGALSREVKVNLIFGSFVHVFHSRR